MVGPWAEVSAFAPMAAEGAADTGQAPAKTQTVAGKEESTQGREAGLGAHGRDGSLSPKSHSQRVAGGHPQP